MRKITFILTAVMLVSSVVMGQNPDSEKQIDKSEYVVAQKAASQGGALEVTDDTYNRIWGAPYDGTCSASASASGFANNVYYDVYEIHTTVAEAADISISSADLSDTYITLYCSFDPLMPEDGVFCGDDDGGAGWLSAFVPADGYILDANTSYYLVVAAYSNGTTGTYTVDMGGNLQFGAPAPPPAVPLSNWAFAIIGLFAIGFVFIKFRR